MNKKRLNKQLRTRFCFYDRKLSIIEISFVIESRLLTKNCIKGNISRVIYSKFSKSVRRNLTKNSDFKIGFRNVFVIFKL